MLLSLGNELSLVYFGSIQEFDGVWFREILNDEHKNQFRNSFQDGLSNEKYGGTMVLMVP